MTDPAPPEVPADGTANVTAPVTKPKKEPTPWERVNLTKAEWDALAIPPEFVRRDATPTDTLRHSAPAPAPAAKRPSGKLAGESKRTETVKPPEPPEPATHSLLGNFASFRVDPEEIERKIRTEADRRWREWMPTKEDRKRPRLSAYVRQVRKEFYP